MFFFFAHLLIQKIVVLYLYVVTCRSFLLKTKYISSSVVLGIALFHRYRPVRFGFSIAIHCFPICCGMLFILATYPVRFFAHLFLAFTIHCCTVFVSHTETLSSSGRRPFFVIDFILPVSFILMFSNMVWDYTYPLCPHLFFGSALEQVFWQALLNLVDRTCMGTSSGTG